MDWRRPHGFSRIMAQKTYWRELHRILLIKKDYCWLEHVFVHQGENFQFAACYLGNQVTVMFAYENLNERMGYYDSCRTDEKKNEHDNNDGLILSFHGNQMTATAATDYG